MNSRERLLTVLRGGIPDCVPVAPDISNMIPARLTGLPYWDLYLYNKIPIWEAYIRAAHWFGIDALMDGYFPLTFPEENTDSRPWETFIVKKNETRIITQRSWIEGGKRHWEPLLSIFHVADPPARNVKPEVMHMPAEPESFEPLEGVRPVDRGPSGLARVKELMGDGGLVGVFAASTAALGTEDAIYNYYDHPELHEKWAAERVERAEKRMARILAMPVKPDFICVGGSGTLVYQTVDIFRQLAFPAVKRTIELATAAGLPTHVHSCGPESALVKIMAEETGLTVIDPLEIPPMGNCDLKELKRQFGKKLTLKGNLHTTDVMLRGTPEDVRRAARKAIDDAKEGGRFILSTGDQCGRDTPYENLFAMIDTARTYGAYA